MRRITGGCCALLSSCVNHNGSHDVAAQLPSSSSSSPQSSSPSSSLSPSSCSSSPSSSPLPLTTPARGRFYRPVTESGWNHFKQRFTQVHKDEQTWLYQHKPMTPMPKPESPVNNYYGQQRLAWNPIPSRVGLVNKKAEDWGYPDRKPPPSGLRRSTEHFPYFFDRYFPNVECRLVIDSVLNVSTTEPVFHFPMDMSKREIHNYLKNVYGLDNIMFIRTRNIKGRYFKNEVGMIKHLPDYKEAVVTLDQEVKVDFKQIKGTEDTPDNQRLT